MTRSDNEKILSSQDMKSLPDKYPDRMGSFPLHGKEQSEKFKSLKKYFKDTDNRLIQQRKCFEETEIKQCYGGEENDEKSDLTKEDHTDCISSDEDTKKRRQLIFKPDGTPDKIHLNQRPDLFPTLDNKTAEHLNNKFSSVLETKAAHMPGNVQDGDKETNYFNTFYFIKLGKDTKHELNNLSRYPVKLVEVESEGEIQEKRRSVVNMCMAINGISESNFLDPYSSEDDQRWNIQPNGQQEKNLQKHISNIFLSLKNEITPLAAEEGIDEKSLNNTLTSLWKKLHSSLTRQQFSKVMDAIEMRKGGKRLPSLLDCFNLLSAGGDLNWEAVSGRMPKKEESSMNLLGTKEDTSYQFEEKKDWAETEKDWAENLNLEERDTDADDQVTQIQNEEMETDSSSLKKIVWDEDLEKEVERDNGSAAEIPQVQDEEAETDVLLPEKVALDEDFNDIKAIDSGATLSEDVGLDKDLTEDMEKAVDEREIDEGNPSPHKITTVADGCDRDMGWKDQSEGYLTTDVDGKNVQVLRPFCSDKTLQDGKENIMKTHRKEKFQTSDESETADGNKVRLDQEQGVCKLKRRCCCGCQSKSRPGYNHIDGRS